MKNLNGTKLQYYSKYPTPPHYPLIFPKVNALWNKNSHFLTIWFNMLSYQSLWVLFLFEICHPKPVSCQSGARFIRSPTQFQGKDWSTNRLEIHPVRTVKDHYQSLDIFPPLKVEWLIFFCSLLEKFFGGFRLFNAIFFLWQSSGKIWIKNTDFYNYGTHTWICALGKYVVFQLIPPIRILNGLHYKRHENIFGPLSPLPRSPPTTLARECGHVMWLEHFVSL